MTLWLGKLKMCGQNKWGRDLNTLVHQVKLQLHTLQSKKSCIMGKKKKNLHLTMAYMYKFYVILFLILQYPVNTGICICWVCMLFQSVKLQPHHGSQIHTETSRRPPPATPTHQNLHLLHQHIKHQTQHSNHHQRTRVLHQWMKRNKQGLRKIIIWLLYNDCEIFYKKKVIVRILITDTKNWNF